MGMTEEDMRRRGWLLSKKDIRKKEKEREDDMGDTGDIDWENILPKDKEQNDSESEQDEK